MDTSILVAFFSRLKILRVIRHYRYLDIGNVSNKFGNHRFRLRVRKRKI